MPLVRKANRVVEVSENRVDGYLLRGYDLIDEEGNIKKHATGGKTIPVGEYNKLVAELKELKGKQDTERLEKRIAELESLNADYEKEIEDLSNRLKKVQQQQKQQKR